MRGGRNYLFCLRQLGTPHNICISFFARRAKNEIQNKEKYRCESAHSTTA
jgi:hypothetical protein